MENEVVVILVKIFWMLAAIQVTVVMIGVVILWIVNHIDATLKAIMEGVNHGNWDY